MSLFTIHTIILAKIFSFEFIDDVYISLRYARNFITGNGLVFNPGEYVEGYTNFLWVILISPFANHPTLAHIWIYTLGIIFSLATIHLVYKLGGKSKTMWLHHCAALLLAVDVSFVFWTTGGLEVPLFTFLVTASIYSLTNELQKPRKIPLTPILLILTCLTRPEGVLISIIIGIYTLINIRKYGTKKFIQASAIFSAPLIIYAIWKLQYYGDILPNTFYAKVGNKGEDIERGWNFFKTFIEGRTFIISILVLIFGIKNIKNHKIALYMSILCTYLIYLILVGGDWTMRFIVPLLPLFYLILQHGLNDCFKSLTKKIEKQKNAITFTVVALLTCTIGYSTYTDPTHEYIFNIKIERYGEIREQQKAFGMWLKENFPEDTLLALGPTGAISYFSEMPTIDMWGLTDKTIARGEKNVNTGQYYNPKIAGHQKSNFQYVLSREPDIIVGIVGFSAHDLPNTYGTAIIPEAYDPLDNVFIKKTLDLRPRAH